MRIWRKASSEQIILGATLGLNRLLICIFRIDKNLNNAEEAMIHLRGSLLRILRFKCFLMRRSQLVNSNFRRSTF